MEPFSATCVQVQAYGSVDVWMCVSLVQVSVSMFVWKEKTREGLP